MPDLHHRNRRIVVCSLFLSLLFWSGIHAQLPAPDPDHVFSGLVSVPDPSWDRLGHQLYAGWASKDIPYARTAVPQVRIQSDTVVYGWKGERVGMEAVLYSRESTEPLTLRVRGDQSIAPHASARFVNYVLTDSFRGCGKHPSGYPPYEVNDMIDVEASQVLGAKTTHPVWVSVEIPRDARAGKHSLRIEVVDPQGAVVQTLRLHVGVVDRLLPDPSAYQFQLNFWMQPYAVSRYEGVKNWSPAHLEALRPYMKMLARAGQKVATAILFYEPWGEQSNDKFEPMVQTILREDSTWTFDYTIFDRWITFLDSCGIKKQINCFSMVPWDMTFRYVDAKTGQYAYLKTTTGRADYRRLWTAFLKDFATHLREKGWFEKTCIAMDERGLSAMNDAYRISQEAVPGIKMALAGNYHASLVDKLYDYCVAYGQRFTAEDLALRRSRGWVTTTYTACPDSMPNVCSNNMPSECAYLPIYCIANGFNGFLRWAWMNWTDDPMHDTRFRMFTPGDTYMVYPGGRSSIRFERIIEGVEAAEKCRILRAEYASGHQTEALRRLDAAIQLFQSGKLATDKTAAQLVNYLQRVLNGLPDDTGLSRFKPEGEALR